MAKKFFIAVLLCFAILAPVFAEFDFNVLTFTDLGFDTESDGFLAQSNTYAGVAYKGGDFEAEVEGNAYFQNDSSENGFKFSKFYASYKFNDFDSEYLTLRAGITTPQWRFDGLGVAGATVSASDEDEEDYLILASQSLGDGYSVEAGINLPLFLEEGSTQKTIIGVMGNKDFNEDFLKAVRAAATYDFNKVLSASVSAKAVAWADLTGGVDVSYNFDDKKFDLELAVNASKDFEIEANSRTMKLTESVALVESVADNKHDSFSVLSLTELDVTENVDVSLAAEVAFSSDDTSAEFTLDAEVEVEPYFSVKPYVVYKNAGSSYLKGGVVVAFQY